MNRLQKIRELSSEKVARKICEYADNLVDEICVAMCPEQDCEPESEKECICCVKKWLESEVRSDGN